MGYAISCYLGLGSNVGNRSEHLEHARQLIEHAIGPVEATSPIYESEPWGETSVKTYAYLNQVIKVETKLPPREVLDTILEIEHTLGRRRTVINAPRTMDIDILFYGIQTIQVERLTVPHPRAHLRKFVLKPMADIAPDYIHPVLGKSIEFLLANCPDDSILTHYSTGAKS